jgi:hypothetical protein
MNHSDSDNQGRKGLAYDWQSLYAASQAADLDAELTLLLAAADHS